MVLEMPQTSAIPGCRADRVTAINANDLVMIGVR